MKVVGTVTRMAFTQGVNKHIEWYSLKLGILFEGWIDAGKWPRGGVISNVVVWV